MPDLLGVVSSIEMTNGLTIDEGPTYRGFVRLRVILEDGSSAVGQLDPDQVREMAMNYLAVAEASEQDAMTAQLLSDSFDLETDKVGFFVSEMRKYRKGNNVD